MKDTKEPFLILLVLFILVGLAYSPLKKNAEIKGSSTSENISSIGTTSDKPRDLTDQNLTEEIKKTEAEIKKIRENLEKQVDESKRSPYYDKITMSNISGLYSNDPNREYLSLSTNLNQNESVNITGWYLQSEVTGYYAIIGKASLLPFPFSKTESDIILKQKDRVYLVKGFSPIGISFRTNKCTGYFEENRTFTPSLSLQCPLPKDENLPKFSDIYDRDDECLELIERISRCTTKGSSFIRDLPDTVTQSCKTYITTQINYNSCVANHFDDTDFPGNEYRVYLNKFGPLWREEREKINLHDQNGLVVDSISY